MRQESTQIDGERVAYIAAGAGNTSVVLVHGGASDRHDWEGNIRPLAEAHQVYAPDLAGFGDCVRARDRYSLQHLSDHLLRFIASVGIGRAHLVGHSLGGRVCLEVARQAPQRVGRMALIAPMGFGRVRPIGAAAVTAVRVWLKITGRPLPYPKLDIPAGEPEIWRLEEVLAPTLLLWGQRDLYFPPSYGRRAAKVLPNARLDIFPHHGHAPHREAPEEFNRQVLDFFAET